jgi:hypothetical protein
MDGWQVGERQVLLSPGHTAIHLPGPRLLHPSVLLVREKKWSPECLLCLPVGQVHCLLLSRRAV